jgi:hypothetical protein
MVERTKGRYVVVKRRAARRTRWATGEIGEIGELNCKHNTLKTFTFLFYPVGNSVTYVRY